MHGTSVKTICQETICTAVLVLRTNSAYFPKHLATAFCWKCSMFSKRQEAKFKIPYYLGKGL